jgi:hypothetical protein
MTRDPKTEVQGLLAADERPRGELNTQQETLALLKILALGNQTRRRAGLSRSLKSSPPSGQASWWDCVTRTAEACDEGTATSSLYARRMCQRLIPESFISATDREGQATRATRILTYGNAAAAGDCKLDSMPAGKGSLEPLAAPDHSRSGFAQCLAGNKPVGNLQPICTHNMQD